jgi:6-pyruvoyltetrahydropterin/6-carboxytetrahydropterin synthase
MFEVTVEAGFSSGHYLRNYHGKCENPHGHNYRVLVTLVGEELDETGLLLDFKLLKHVLRPVVERLDHLMINDIEPFIRAEPFGGEPGEATSSIRRRTQLEEMTSAGGFG